MRVGIPSDGRVFAVQADAPGRPGAMWADCLEGIHQNVRSDRMASIRRTASPLSAEMKLVPTRRRDERTLMYKCVWLIKFRPELDPSYVREEWRTSHGALALKVPGIKRYVQNHWVDTPLDCERTYDGSVDCWFESKEAFEASWTSPEWQTLLEDDRRLFDRTLVPAFEGGVVNEHIMRWEGLPEGRVYTSAGTIPPPAEG